MNTCESIRTILGIVAEYMSRGLTPDDELLHFISSSYGLTDRDEIIEFLSSGSDAGAVADLLSYPPDDLRKSVEFHIPDEGIPEKLLEEYSDLHAFSDGCYILLDKKIFYLTEQDSLSCFRKIIRRLNLATGFTYLSGFKDSLIEPDVYDIRVLLRKNKFSSGASCCGFIRDLIAGYNSAGEKSEDELISLVKTAAYLVNKSEMNPYDILSEKNEYYRNAYMEALEFSRLMKSYSMEFIMMKRLQPPLVTAEEALSMMEKIFRMTSLARGSGGSGFNFLF